MLYKGHENDKSSRNRRMPKVRRNGKTREYPEEIRQQAIKTYYYNRFGKAKLLFRMKRTSGNLPFSTTDFL